MRSTILSCIFLAVNCNPAIADTAECRHFVVVDRLVGCMTRNVAYEKGQTINYRGTMVVPRNGEVVFYTTTLQLTKGVGTNRVVVAQKKWAGNATGYKSGSFTVVQRNWYAAIIASKTINSELTVAAKLSSKKI